MRDLPDDIAALLAGGVTTLCHGWRLMRRDGVVLGFTDHDRDLDVAGVVFRAASGVAASESSAAQGLAVTGAELSGALSADALTEDDLAAGLYDGADMDLLLIDWTGPESHMVLRRGRLGEIRRQDGAFTCEIRSLADAFNETRGRVFTAGCDADLGDARCTVNLDDPRFTATAVVNATDGAARLDVTGLEGFAQGWFARGRCVVLDGANAGFATEVKAHEAGEAGAALRLWQRPPAAFAAGDRLGLTAGCNKQFSTCRDRFANALNFRGFPHMPGNDFVITVAVPGEGGYDGSLL